MIYEEGILAIPKQFAWQAEVINKGNLKPFKRIIVLGMGGSRLGADMLNMMRPDLDIHIHSDYQLPGLSQEVFADALVIANSYSGDTQETISGAKSALAQDYNVAIIGGGGELLEMAEQAEVPHVRIPRSELPARLMVGYDMKALMAILDFPDSMYKSCAHILPLELKKAAHEVVGQITNSIPLIYSSERLNELGYCWKVILNETAKIPVFCNRLPELTHNEIESFSSPLSARLSWVMLADPDDTDLAPKMNAMVQMLRIKQIPGVISDLEGSDVAEQVVASFITAHWTALLLADKLKVDPVATPFIDEFKKHIDD